MTASLGEQLAAIELVGPKGYVHGWHFVGIPAVGTKITLPRGRRGTVVGGTHHHARVRTASGDIYKIPHDKGKAPARLVRDKSKPEPEPVPQLSPERQEYKRLADASIARGETLFHGTNHQFKPGDIIDAKYSRRGVTLLHEGKSYAFASTDPGEATFAGRVGREGHVYRVVPAGDYEYDTHQGSATSRRTTGGFRVVEEVQQWSGKAVAPARAATTAEKRAYVKTGKLPPGVTLHTAGNLSGQLIELVFDPHELRIPKGMPHGGEWVHTPSARPGTGIHRYVVPDPERLVIPPPKKPGRRNYYERPGDHPFFQAHPVSVANILRAYGAADEGTRAQGRDWYRQNHEVAKIIGGGNAEEGAILLSAYTAQKPWPYNMFQAMKSARRGKALGPGEGMAITGANQKTAQAAIDGASIDEALPGPKTHSFAVLLAQGDDSPDDPYGHVVIDTHALNVAAGGTVRGDEGKKAPIGNPRWHQYVADQYREAARQISEREGVLMKPHQLQAVTWMVQQQASQAQDAADAASGRLSKGDLGRARGRVNMTRNAWKVWMAYAKKHNVQLVPGISSLAGQVALARLVELAGGRSLTAELVSTVGADMDLAFDINEPRDPATGRWVDVGGWENLDKLLQREFGPDPLEARRVKHPRSGYMVKAGEERRVNRPPARHGLEATYLDKSLGVEGPATFDVRDHGDPNSPEYNSLKYMNPQVIRTEPIKHVYRGMSAGEWRQAQERGYIESDRRGAISDLEGTNAAVDPRSAVSYLPREGDAVVAKIAVRPEDKWFTISADEYLRTRQRVPLSAVQHVLPMRRVKIGKYGEGLETRQTDLARCGDCGCPTVGAELLELAAWTHERRVPKGMPGGGRWYHGTSFVHQPGDVISPPGGETGFDRMFIIDRPKVASHYARMQAISRYDEGARDARPHIYEVEPVGDVTDEEPAHTGSSAKNLKVVREVPFQAPYKYGYPPPWETKQKQRRVRPVITAAEARGNSRPVSMDEFQHLAALGNRWIDKAKRDATPTTGLDLQWDKIKADAYAEVQKEWGGATINAHTGVPIRHNADLYALSVKPAHMHTVSVPEMASEAEFGAAMDTAKELFRPALERKAFHLGVFHDDEHHRIDMDPVAIVDSTDLVEQVGAYTRAIGGAYHFKTGDGYWPPHVASGADMAADETTVHFRGPGEWHSQAVEVQDPEPTDEPEPVDE